EKEGLVRLSAITPVVLLCGSVASSAIAQVATTQPSDARNPQVIYVVPEGQAFRRSTEYLPIEPRAIAPDSIAQQYSVVIRLDSTADITSGGFNTAFSSLDSQTAASLLTSSALVDPPALQVLGLSPQQRRDAVVVNVYPTGVRIARVEVTLLKSHGDYGPDAAHKLTSALMESLKNAFEQSTQAAHKAATERRAPIEKELKEAKDRAEALHAKIRELRGINANLSRGMDPQYSLDNLRNTKRNTESEIARNKARLEAIDSTSGPLSKELADVLKLRQQQLDEVTKRQKAGTATPADVADAEAKVIEARAALAQAHQTSSSPNRIDRTSEIAGLRSSIAEAEERLKQTNEQIAKLDDPKFAAAYDQLPDMQTEEQRLRTNIFNLNSRLEQIRQTSDIDAEVTITVLDGQQKKS
ncbi:MAG TPA: hypothetical protein VFW23_05930, partial [Tepidisphaeraceae bacterium]|nr:hypothetical protein [Tepidisphaeraceae bacterium]